MSENAGERNAGEPDNLELCHRFLRRRNDLSHARRLADLGAPILPHFFFFAMSVSPLYAAPGRPLLAAQLIAGRIERHPLRTVSDLVRGLNW